MSNQLLSSPFIQGYIAGDRAATKGQKSLHLRFLYEQIEALEAILVSEGAKEGEIQANWERMMRVLKEDLEGKFQTLWEEVGREVVL